ncbi:MAG: hypothetical protein R6V10_13190 [bacterium]
MKRYFVNPKSLKKRQVSFSTRNDRVEARIKGEAINWQVIE